MTDNKKPKIETRDILRRMLLGFPDTKWAIYFDKKLGKETILNSEGATIYEKLFNGELRYNKMK